MVKVRQEFVTRGDLFHLEQDDGIKEYSNEYLYLYRVSDCLMKFNQLDYYEIYI